MMPGTPERRTHDYARHGVASLFAAFNIEDGTVISELHRRHRHREFLKFLKRIDKNVPASLDVHPRLDRAMKREPAPLRLDEDSRGNPQLPGRISVEDFRRITLAPVGVQI
jgi:hypothetical protein